MSATIYIPDWLKQQAANVTDLPHAFTWLSDYRAQHWQMFLKHGLPKQSERWRYADLSLLDQTRFSPATCEENNENNENNIAELIRQHRLQENTLLFPLKNGSFVQMHQACDVPGVIACPLSAALQHHEQLIKKYWPEKLNASSHPFASVNAAMFTDGLFLYLPAGCKLSVPVQLLSCAAQQHGFAAHPHHVIILEEDSKLTLLEEYVSTTDEMYMMNVMTHILLKKNARLMHYKIQHESQKAIHIASTFIKQMQDSEVSFNNFSMGSAFSRDELTLQLLAPGASCATQGFYHLTQDKQYIDHSIDIQHIAPHTQSKMLYKGILNKKSRAVFNGRVHVKKNAQKILAYQENHNLLLSNAAEVYSRPELEIYADDVQCKHGATTGQLNSEALFYLRSRGIAAEQARDMLLQGFADEVMQTISHAEIKKRVYDLFLANRLKEMA